MRALIHVLRQRKLWTFLAAALVATGSGCGRSLPPSVASDEGTYRDMRSELNKGAGSGAGATAVERTGFATIRGRFRALGNVPQPVTLFASGDDTAYCSSAGTLLRQEVLVGAGGAFANVLIHVDQKIPQNWDEHPDYAAQKTATLTEVDGKRLFDQKNCMFLSRLVAFRGTQSLTIYNSDTVAHNTKVDPSSGAEPDNKLIPGTANTTYTPNGASKVPFRASCAIHPWMDSHLVTFDHPYFAVSKQDGTFEIKNVPAGPGLKLKLRLWQEKLGYLSTVTLNGNEVTLKKGRMKPIEVLPDAVVELDIAVTF